MKFDFTKDAERKVDPIVWSTDDLQTFGKLEGIFTGFREYEITDKETGEQKLIKAPVICFEPKPNSYVYITLPAHYSLLDKLKDVKINSAVQIEIGKEKIGTGLRAFFPYTVVILKAGSFEVSNSLKKFLNI